MSEIVNRVANSGIITLDLADFKPKGSRVLIDIKDQLWQGLVLKEKDFRTYIKSTDWSSFKGKYVAVDCSADAIIPNWAYMLLATALEPFAKKVCFGPLSQMEAILFNEEIEKIDFSQYQESRIVIKGCGDEEISPHAFVALSNKLQNVAKTIMYGEPCSTVPVWKKPKN